MRKDDKELGEGQVMVADSGQKRDANLISQIRYWHRQRCFAMEQRKRSDLALGSFLRTALGWSKALPDADRKRINDQARALIGIGEAEAKAKSPTDVDEPAYVEWRDVILASLAARALWDATEKRATKEMAALAKHLPVYPWAEGIRGFGNVSLAIIVAEAGDLSGYASHSKLWKRMGEAPFTKNGKTLSGAQWRKEGGFTKDDWIEAGYSPIRRSRMWNIGDAMIKVNGDGEYRKVYLARKDYERARAEANGLTVAPAAKIPAKRAAEFMSDGHVHRRAQRYMEKRLLRNLWRAWRANMEMAERPSRLLPATEHRDEREAIAPMPDDGAIHLLPTAQLIAAE